MLKLYDKTYTTKYGTFDTLTEAFVEEERNGLFELSFIILNTDNLFNYVKEENIVVANANDALLNQKFRIYMTRKLMNNKVEVFARHISFDLMYDYVDNLSFNNQSCEYALKQLFINSNFSKHYKGYSDIVNAQNYKMSMANILEAIGGKKGSIIDTFGNGAEILRDNENIHILNRRGNDNEVSIEYRKNLTGFELEEDSTDLVTRILPYAKYNDNETSKEVTVKANFVDSPLINNYSHPYIKAIDYSEKFDEEVPTAEKLISLAEKEYRDNKIDRLKQNFKIDFIPLSKCVGYEGLEDKINICDTVTIIDTRYNINTKAKVIRTVFNILKNRYESIELGEPRTTLGDIIGSGGSNEPVVGPPGPQGPPGEDGNLGDFPDSLPAIPVLNSFVYGFSNIELTWSFENKIYYQYELYASKIKDFNPNSFDLIFQGQASSYMFQAKPNETWYFKVCAINTHGKRTNFSNQAIVTTKKIEDLSNYVQDMAIGEALIGELSLDRGWVGKLNANLLDVKGNFSVTDGNGKRTMDIDSFGNVSLDVASFRLKSKDVATEDYANSITNNAKNEVIKDTKAYTDAQISLVNGEISLKASKTEVSTSKNEAINSASKYTDSAKNEAINTSNKYTDSAKSEAINASKIYTDSQITLTNDKIELKASKTEVSTTKSEAINTSKAYTDSAKNEAINNSNNYSDAIKKELSSQIEVASNKISQEVKEVETTANGALTKASSIEQTANSLTIKVSSLDDKYTEIKQTVDGIDLTGKVSFSDLTSTGKTVINGSNITTGTINASKVTVTNLNAKDITTGTMSADRISGGTIQGSLLQTYANDSTRGVRIAKESMQLNNTAFFYDSNFNIQCKEGINIGAMQNIYLMAGLNSNGSQNGYGEVVIPNATLRTQRLEVVNNATIYGNLSTSGSVSASSFKVGNNLVYHAGNKPTPSEIGASPTSHTHSTYLSTSGGTISGTLTVSGSVYTRKLADGSVNWWVLSSGVIYAGKSINMNGYTITGQSDRRLKENISYIDRVKNESSLKDSFYNDFKNKFKFATYNYKKEDQKDRTHFGFIAQDIEDTSFSDYVLMKNKNENNEDVLGYDIQALINVYGSILQKEIETRDKQIEDLISRLTNLEKLLNIGSDN